MRFATWFQRLLLPVETVHEVLPSSSLDGGDEQGSVAVAERSPEPRAPLPVRGEPEPEPPLASVGNLDCDELASELPTEAQADLLQRVGERVDSGRFGMPRLPPTCLLALEMVSRPTVEVRHLVATIQRDPLLTSEMLRIANSAMFAMRLPAETLQDAVMRIGLHFTRGAVLTAALRNGVADSRSLAAYSEEVWRASQSVARIARAIGGELGFEVEHAYLLGLLHDIGKVALLGILESEVQSADEVSPAFVGRVFRAFHERAGREMARAWKLPDEIVAVAAQHHDFGANTTHPRGAALAFLAHRIDVDLSLGDDAAFEALAQSPAFDVLKTPEDVRWEVLEHARRVWNAAEEALARRR